MILNYNTEIINQSRLNNSQAIERAKKNLLRDIRKACKKTEVPGIHIYLKDQNQDPEGYCIQAKENRLEINASDELGFVYGLYAVSREILGILEFWFWNDQKIIPKKEFEIPENYIRQSGKAAVRYRGWFVNDEVLLHTWKVERKEELPWEMAFEALLRCGGNLVIPGTDTNAKKYRRLAGDMGLYITHHHAEPLGAEMFARAYPDLSPSYREHADKFHELWKAAIEQQKNSKVIWNIGFRGQGDCPFWNDDPEYRTPEARGTLMGNLIRMQYDMVKEQLPDAVCCTNLYGETMELYQEGYLKLPEDVIKIWADNGYGKMVTRRQGNHNPRVCSLPEKEEKGSNGIYYHVSFYDLQAANHMTMLPNSPEFVKSELEQVLDAGADQYWLINCSNIKPHVYFLDLLREFWENGTADIAAHREQYTAQYYGEANQRLTGEILRLYPEYALSYGKQEDEHAGEQFSNHVPRILITQYVKCAEQKAEELDWLGKAQNLEDQVCRYGKLCRRAMESYEKYLLQCEKADAEIEGEENRTLFRDSLLLQVKLHYYCYTGAWYVCKSLQAAEAQDYRIAFYYAGIARKNYQKANASMRDREHGKWHDFYANECLTDIKQTAWILKGFMSYLRALGDGPHYYQWQRDFLYAEEDKRVMLVMNMENHLEDEELFGLMEEKFGETNT